MHCRTPATSPNSGKTYGSGALPRITRGRREVKRLSGQSWVPLLVTDDGGIVQDTATIIAWAQGHPAPVPAQTARA